MKNITKNIKPSIQYLEILLKKANILLTQKQLELLWKYHKLLRKYNSECDLTRLYNFETITTKHYIDSIIINKLVKITDPIIDIGTGGGLPGIPLKIINPELIITLAEPKPQRVKFLNIVIDELKLKNINLHPHKISKTTELSGYNAVITRAFETMDKTIIRTKKILNNNAKLYFMKGPNCSEEIEEALKASSDISLVNDIHYKISEKDKRRLVIFSY